MGTRSKLVLGPALALALALAFSGCASGDDDSTTAPTSSDDQELGTGVTADSVKIAVSMVDFECIQNYVDDIWVGGEEAYQAYVDDINDKGGINGRKVEVVFKEYCPIPGSTPNPSTICTSAIEDDEVFAIMGTFYDPTGDAQLCVTKDHDGVLITHMLSDRFMEEATPGLLLTPDSTAERRLDVIMSLLESEGTLEGKKVSALADNNAESRISDSVDPALEQIGVERGSDGVVTITNDDTTAAQAQLDSLIERWKSEDVNTLILVGELVQAKQFVEKIKSEIPDMLLIADGPTPLAQAQDLVRGNVDPNPYEGLLTAEGETGTEHAAGPEAAESAEIYKAQTGKEVPPPDEVIEGPNGKRIDVYGMVGTACVEVRMFADIAEKVGEHLNAANWTKTVDTFGPIRIMSTKYASLGEGKYDADDTYRLVAFDSSIPEDGDWAPVTPIRDVGNL